MEGNSDQLTETEKTCVRSIDSPAPHVDSTHKWRAVAPRPISGAAWRTAVKGSLPGGETQADHSFFLDIEMAMHSIVYGFMGYGKRYVLIGSWKNHGYKIGDNKVGGKDLWIDYS